MRCWTFAFSFVAAFLAVSALHADEGIWLFNQFPKVRVAAKYKYEVTDAFLNHLRAASTRFNNGGSGSFVSPNGLLFTNHHVGSECIQAVSSAEHNYMRDGFYAASEGDERKCPDLEVDVLTGIRDVTSEVKSATPADSDPAQANRLRKAAMSRLEKECNAKTGDRCEVVTLYSGGEYNLYQYKKYTDIRLVFAPEEDIAAFGGDPDNFTYPRYCLDFALFRAYENGKPVKPADYLRWSREGIKDGELIFVSGNPGSTGRLSTMAELNFLYSATYPLTHMRLTLLVNALLKYAAESPENKRVARENLLLTQNSLKAYTGFLNGLHDPGVMRLKQREEDQLRSKVAGDPGLNRQYGAAWGQISEAYAQYGTFYKQNLLFERFAGQGSELMQIARLVVRYSEEKQKPDGERLREYSDARLPAIEQEMYSPEPITDSMETVVITEYLKFLRQILGAEDETVKAALHGLTPESAAKEYVGTSKLADVAERKRLANDPKAVQNSHDGMIRLARILDAPARRYRKQYEDRIQALLTQDESKLAQARFALFGAEAYPDATFTLRLSYGQVRGYPIAITAILPYTTTFDGLYKRAKDEDPYKLPPRWVAIKDSLDMATPFNFVSTADTHGGNSGSPTVDEKGEIVGILFDGNIESLPNRFVYTETQARSVHVASQAIIESLRKVYHADRVLNEIGMGK